MRCIQPNYFNDFQCDGRSCGVRCCRDWQIVVDGETCEKYLSLAEDERKKIFEKINVGEISTLKMDSRGVCKFLDEDFLCSMQKCHGENFLTATCQSFPRITYRLDENFF